MLRLFNRGHLEEPRFIAALQTIGVKIYQVDENGKQFRISDCDGHFGGSGDGVAVGLPDLPNNLPALLEFKTHNKKSFEALIKVGVKKQKPEHYIQMQIYLKKMGLSVALYGAVNKNDDDFYLELVGIDNETAEKNIERAKTIIVANAAPKKINTSPGWLACAWCDHKPVCHFKAAPALNCRSCRFSEPVLNGQWNCKKDQRILNKDEQLKGCDSYAANT
jgi:hypothetical protein